MKVTSRAAGGSFVTSRPPIDTRPRSGRSSPATSRKVVVLPAPVGPSSTTNSPSATVRVRSPTAAFRPKLLLTESSRISAMRRLLVERGAQGPAGALDEEGKLLGAEIETDLLPRADRSSRRQ